jgi:hypothetical protein
MRLSGGLVSWFAIRVVLLTLFSAVLPLHAQSSRRGGYGGRPAASAEPPRMGPATAELPAVTYEGKLTDLTDKLIVLELDEGRAFNFKRAGNTQFFKADQTVKPQELTPGDRVSIVARMDDRAFLVAMKVSYVELTPEKEAEIAVRVRAAKEAADQPNMVMRRAELGPVLKRRDTGDGDEASSSAATSSSKSAAFDRTPENDPLISKAQDAAFTFSDSLPNFLCEESMGRFSQDHRASGWQSLDTVSAEVIYEDGQESYRNLKIDGRPTDKKIEQLSGSWSTGEFATTMRNLFHPASDTRFRYVEETTLLDRRARVYDFEVEQVNSHWNVQIEARKITPGYAGSVWLDAGTGRVLRLETHAVGIPTDFPMDQIESSVDYSTVEIGGEGVLMPSHAENLGCQRGSNYCSRNVIDFRNYRKYVSDSTIKFDP